MESFPLQSFFSDEARVRKPAHRRARGAVLLLGLLLFAGLAGSSQAQVREVWTRTHDGAPSHEDLARAIAVAPNGDVHVSGDSFITGTPTGSQDYFIDTLTYDAAGNVLWSARFTPVPDVATDVWDLALSPQGDTYVAATVTAPSSFLQQVFVLKYSSSGSLLWSQTYPGLMGLPGVSIVVDGSGNVFLGGSGTDPNYTFWSITKIDPFGSVVWSAHMNPSLQNESTINALALAPNGDVVGTGWYRFGGTGPSRAQAMRVSSSGTLLWLDNFGGPLQQALNWGNDIAVDTAGNVYVAGVFDAYGIGFLGNQALTALDPNGLGLWSKNIDGEGNGADDFIGIAVDPFGRIVAAGSTTNAALDKDVSVRVFDALGNDVWSRTFDDGAHGLDQAFAMSVDASGNIHVAGSGQTTGTAGSALAIGYDPTGELRYAEIIPLTTQFGMGEGFHALAVTPSGAIALTGADNGVDFLTVLLERTAVPYCFGDGSGTACPCGNASAAVTQSGCASSFGFGGRLIDTGASSLSADTLVLNGTHMTSSACLYFQGTSAVAAGSGAAFGDGLRCAGGAIVGLSTKQNVNGESAYPEDTDASVSVRGGITSPGNRTYQVWYRNAAAFCTPSTFNLSNGLRVTWVP